jgi:hypothetical protein
MIMTAAEVNSTEQNPKSEKEMTRIITPSVFTRVFVFECELDRQWTVDDGHRTKDKPAE